MSKDYQRISESPILRTTPVKSKAPGLEAIGGTLGQVSQMLFQKAESIQKEESATQYLQAEDQMAHAVTQAQEQMLMHPNQSKYIADQTKETLGAISKSAVVNKQNRGQLEYSQHRSEDKLHYAAVSESMDQSRRMGKFGFLSTFDQTLKTYEDYLLHDPDKAEGFHDNIESNIRGLVSTQILTPHEGASALNAMGKITQNIHSLHDRFKEGGSNAAEAAGHVESLLSSKELDRADLPHDASTAHIFDSHSQDIVAQNAFAKAQLHQPFSYAAYNKMSEASKQKLAQYWEGSSNAAGLVNSGTPYPKILSRLQDLKNQGKTLTAQETAEKAYLEDYQKNLNNGDYLSVAANTNLGSKYIQDYRRQETAITDMNKDEHGNLSPEGIMQRNSLFNDFVSNMATLGHAQHLPSNLIQPLPPQKIGAIQQAFDAGGDVGSALNELSSLRSENRAYAAQGMKTPVQQQAVLMAGYLTDEKDDAFKTRLLQHSQTIPYGPDGVAKTAFQVAADKDGKNSKQVEYELEPYLKDILNHRTKSPDFREDVAGIRGMAMNWIYGEAMRHNDITMSKFDDYAMEFKQHASKAYNLTNGYNFSFNKKDVPLDQHEGEMVTNYLLDKFNKDQMRVSSSDQVYSNNLVNPKFVTATPDRMIIIMNSLGEVVHSEPFQTDLLDAARHYHDEKQKNLDNSLFEKFKAEWQ